MKNKILEENKDVITYGESINHEGDECYWIYVNDVNTFKIPKEIDKKSEVFNWSEKCNYIPNGQKYIGEASYYFAEGCNYDDADNVMEFFEKYNSNDAGKDIYIIKYDDKYGQEYKDEWIAKINIEKSKFRCGVAQDERFMGVCYFVDELADHYYPEDGEEPEDSDYRLVEQNRIALTKEDAKQLVKDIIAKKNKKTMLELEYLEKL